MKVISVSMIGWPLLAIVPILVAIVFWLLSSRGPVLGNNDCSARALALTVLRLGCNAVLRRSRRPWKECRQAPIAALVPVVAPPIVRRGPAKAAFRANSAAHRLSSAPAVSRRSHAMH